MKRWEEAEPIGCAHGLFEVTLLIHELLNGVVCFHGAAFNHLNRRERGRRGSFILLFIKMFFFFCKICQLTRNVKTNCRIYIYLFYFENSRMEKVVYVQGYYSVPCKEVLTFPLRQHDLLALQTTQHFQDPQHEGVLIDDLTVLYSSFINFEKRMRATQK